MSNKVVEELKELRDAINSRPKLHIFCDNPQCRVKMEEGTIIYVFYGEPHTVQLCVRCCLLRMTLNKQIGVEDTVHQLKLGTSPLKDDEKMEGCTSPTEWLEKFIKERQKKRWPPPGVAIMF